jgi:hypothetical protein
MVAMNVPGWDAFGFVTVRIYDPGIEPAGSIATILVSVWVNTDSVIPSSATIGVMTPKFEPDMVSWAGVIVESALVLTMFGKGIAAKPARGKITQATNR